MINHRPISSWVLHDDVHGVVDNKSKETLAISVGKGDNQDNDDKGESSPNEMKKPESQVCKDVVCSQVTSDKNKDVELPTWKTKYLFLKTTLK